MIRVAELSELPPGKGKVVGLADRRLTIYNLDGRLVATATRARRPRPELDADGRAHCVFEVFAEDSPARLRADELACHVTIEDGVIWLDAD